MRYIYYKCPKCDVFHFKKNTEDTSDFINHLKEKHDITEDINQYEVKYICPLTGSDTYKNENSRGPFWKYINKKKINDIKNIKYKYDYPFSYNKKDLLDVESFGYLYETYFEKNITQENIRNIIGFITRDLFIILAKVYNKDMDIDEYLHSLTEENVIEENVTEENVIEENTVDIITNIHYKKYDFILGDCIVELKRIPTNFIDIVVTSPPYNIGLKYHKYNDKKPREQYLEWIYDIFVELKRILKKDGHIFLNMGYTNKDPWISMEVALKLKDLFILQNKITWVKSISIGEDKDDTYGHFKPINSDRYINVTNEDIYHFTKTDNVKINREAVGVPYKWECNLIDRKTKLHRINKKTGLPVENKRCKGNSWFVPYPTIWNKSQKGFHPATFPEGLVEHCIKISDVKEGVILDPFIGSGTTVRTAKKMTDTNDAYNLSGIGIDIDETYITYCKESIKD